MRSEQQFAVAIAICCCFAACVKPLTSHEVQIIINTKPKQCDIEEWFNKDLKYIKTNVGNRLVQYNNCVEKIISNLKSGESIKIKSPSVAPTYKITKEVDYLVPHPIDHGLKWDHYLESDYTEIDEEFGIPIVQIQDSVSINEAIEISATRRILRWYSKKGIFPINSTKRQSLIP